MTQTQDSIKIEKIFYQTNKLFQKKQTLLYNVSIAIPHNTIFALIGPNGAGKTTTIKCILNFIKYKGQIKIQSSKNKIGYSPDSPILYDYLTGIEHLVFFGKIGGQTKHYAQKKGIELLEKLGLKDAYNTQTSKYSKGMKQRLGIAISLINNPDIIIMDEPMSGLDPLGRILIKKLFFELKEIGKTIIFSTHILSDVEEISDNFSIMDKGTILIQDKTSNHKNGLEKFFLNTIQQNVNTK